MKKPMYDQPDFFNNYSKMARSQNGLAGAGEWQTLEKILPNAKGKAILDLGCGYGWHCRYFSEQSASSVIGVDVSEKMLAVAKEKNSGPHITYLQESIEAIDFETNQFDLIFSSLAFHYVKDYPQLIKKIRSFLKPEGQLIFSIEHPVFTASGQQDWLYDAEGNILTFPVDRYFDEGVRRTNFLGGDITKYHRTMTTLVETLLDQDFTLDHFSEPFPSEEMIKEFHMEDELRRPMMMILAATKK